MTLEDLAHRTREPAEELERWRAMALIAGDEDAVALDAERVRLIQFARSRGITPETIAELLAAETLDAPVACAAAMVTRPFPPDPNRSRRLPADVV
jgi:hypothetical protein